MLPRLPLALVLAALAAGCAEGTPQDAADSDADRLLARVTDAAVADAFARLDRVAYTATQQTTQGGAETTTTTVREGDGTQAADDAPRPRDPIGPALPAEPPFVDPASRDQYRRTVLGDTTVAGRRLRVVEAVLTDVDAEQQVRRAWAAVDPETGQPVLVEVDREADSVVYTEVSRARVELAAGPGGAWVPRRIETDTRTDVPLSDPVRVRVVWDVRVEG